MFHTVDVSQAAGGLRECDLVAAKEAAEKPAAIAAFAPLVQSYQTGISMADVSRDTGLIEQAIRPDYPYSGGANFLFRYFGRELLPKVLPDVRIAHARVEHGTEALAATALLDGDIVPIATVNGYSLTDIVSCIGGAINVCTAPRRAHGTSRREALANGQCDAISRHCIRALLEPGSFDGLEPDTRLIRLDDMPSRREDDGYPAVVPLGMGHSLFRIALRGAASEQPGFVSFDPTVAQVDATDEYDLELAYVPPGQFVDFARLRYGMPPDADIEVRRCPA